MLVSTCKKKFFLLAHVWFRGEHDTITNIKSDIVFVHDTASFIKNSAFTIITPHKTLITDLTQDEGVLLQGISKKCIYKARQAKKEGVSVAVYSSKKLLAHPELVEEFTDAYNNMYIQKGLCPCFNLDTFHAYLKADMLKMTVARYNEQPDVFHTYIVSNAAVRILHSVSKFREENANRNKIARANIYLHYADLLVFKGKGVLHYDWGGIFSFDDPNGIDRFKMEFGGHQMVLQNAIIGKSLWGKFLVAGKKALTKLR